ncbi:MAG: flagellar assembly protein FliH [Gammaproteobacteria bacterium]
MSLSDIPVTEHVSVSDLAVDPKPSFDRWETPEFAPESSANGSPGISIQQLEELQKQAYEEAYAVGIQDGFKAGAEKSNKETQRLNSLLQQFAHPFEELDDVVEKQVVQLALVVARNIIRRELKTEPTHVIGAVREALTVLPVASRDVTVRLHPEDAVIVRKYLKPAEGERAWAIVEDPVLTRGGCVVDTEFSHVDARIEARISALVATLFGDERESTDTPKSQSSATTPQGESEHG